MTNTLNKIMHNGDEYNFPEWFNPWNAGSTWQVLTKTNNGYEYDDIPSQHSTITVMLLRNWWSNNEQTVSATGVTSSNTVIVSPVPADMDDYTSNKVKCSAQGSGTLTFECDTTPTDDIDVNVVILN